MGNLTEDMRRLHQEIDSLHANRKAFINGLVLEVENLRNNVFIMQNNFQKARLDRMKDTKAGLSGFMTDLKQTVTGLRADISTDILRSRRIWSESPCSESVTRPNIKIHITPHIKEESKPKPEIKKAKPAIGGSKGKIQKPEVKKDKTGKRNKKQKIDN